MSRKNHKNVNGKLLQMDKTYSSLKQRQKEKIADWMYEETLLFYHQHGKMPAGDECVEIINQVYQCIEQAEIWIPFSEIETRYIKKKTSIIKRINKESKHIEEMNQNELN